ncbi:hypothetical protein GCM10027293_18150 [Pontibacter aydingkolensis]
MIALVAMIGSISNAWAQATIATTLPATVKAHSEVTFDVNVAKNDATAENVKVVLKLTGDNAATFAANTALKTAAGTAITFDGTEAVLGIYPLTDRTEEFIVKFSVVGTVGYTLELRDVASGDPLPGSVTSTVTVNFNEPTLDSTLDNYTDIKTNKGYLFHPIVTAGDRAGEMVNLTLTFTDPAHAQNVKLYRATNAQGTGFVEVTFENGVATVGPEGGYPLADAGAVGENLYKIVFSEVGVYNYTFKLMRTDGVAIATKSETVTVVRGATIATTLHNRADVVATIAEDFKASATAGTWAPTTMVLGKLTLTNPAQVDDIKLEYLDTDNTYKEIIIGTDGVVTIGPAGGMPISDLSGLDFKATFAAAGTYGYTLELIKIEGNEVIATSNESVVVRAFVNATIASDLNNRTGVKTTVPQTANVTINANDNAGTEVLAKLTLANAAQRENVTLELRTGENTYEAISINENGVAYFGPTTGYPLADATTAIRVTFDEAGTYAYTLALVTAGTTETVVASSNESVTVAAFQNASIATTLDQKANVKTTRAEEFTITATAGDIDPATMVLGRLALTTPAQADDITLEYFDTDNTYKPIAIGTDGVVTIGPAGGMMLSNINGLKLRATFDAAATYGYKVELVRVSDNTVLATSNESVVVSAFVGATVATTLNGQEVEKDAAKMFTATATANDVNPATMVRGRLTLADASKAANIVLEYLNDQSEYQTIAFENGVALIGPATGMALSDINSLGFRATFNAAGTYAYTLDLVNVDGGAVVATASESVEVKTATSIKKGFEKGGFAVYPTLTTGAVKVDLVNARNANIQVIDMMGRAVVAKSNVNGVVELDLSKVAKGTYVVRIQDGNNINTQRVIVR